MRRIKPSPVTPLRDEGRSGTIRVPVRPSTSIVDYLNDERRGTEEKASRKEKNEKEKKRKRGLNGGGIARKRFPRSSNLSSGRPPIDCTRVSLRVGWAGTFVTAARPADGEFAGRSREIIDRESEAF